MGNWLLRRVLGDHVSHALTCDRCFDRMMAEFIESLS